MKKYFVIGLAILLSTALFNKFISKESYAELIEQNKELEQEINKEIRFINTVENYRRVEKKWTNRGKEGELIGCFASDELRKIVAHHNEETYTETIEFYFSEKKLIYVYMYHKKYMKVHYDNQGMWYKNSGYSEKNYEKILEHRYYFDNDRIFKIIDSLTTKGVTQSHILPIFSVTYKYAATEYLKQVKEFKDILMKTQRSKKKTTVSFKNE